MRHKPNEKSATNRMIGSISKCCSRWRLLTVFKAVWRNKVSPTGSKVAHGCGRALPLEKTVTEERDKKKKIVKRSIHFCCSKFTAPEIDSNADNSCIQTCKRLSSHTFYLRMFLPMLSFLLTLFMFWFLIIFMFLMSLVVLNIVPLTILHAEDYD